uniref:OSJNBa0055C08.7 protein n=1 Tax=Oryza sativa subsp. japonica TaxID=39947 RepID=Q7XVN4_ORYSJ|nr:OSJNBa0055C08.7 [Oryza sativa Japonica Group]
MVTDLNLPPEEEGDGGALPNLNGGEADMEEDGRLAAGQGDNLDQVEWQAHVHALHVFDLNLHPFDLNFEATEEEEQIHLAYDHQHMEHDLHVNAHVYEEQQQVEDGDDALQLELEALENYLQDYGVYADAVNVVFDVEELPNSHEVQHANGNERSQSRDLKNMESMNEKLEKDTTSIVAREFHVSIRTVQRIWKKAKVCREQGIAVNVDSRKHGSSGRKKVEVDLSLIAAIPLQQKSNIRSLAQALGVPKSTLHRWFKEGLIRRHSNSLKPYLKEANKKERLRWCVSMLDPSTLPNSPKFIEMENIIHIDEKWFNGSKKEKTFYLYPDEEEPYFTVHNKNAIDKVMFLAAVANPRFDDEGNCTFDGKICIWPFVRKEPAQRRSRNRERGTLVTKPIKVDRNTIRSFMISKVLPAIRACWPREDAGKTIWIQQDNARTHLPINDEQFAVAVAQTGLDIRLVNQPPNSPDMNCLDLGFFASLQSLTYNRTSRNMDELIENVHKEYRD